MHQLYLEKGDRNTTRMPMTQNSQGKREHGRLKQSWGLTMTKERDIKVINPWEDKG